MALFARSRRRVELTPEGTRLLGEARRMLAQLERTVQEVRGMARGEEGRLRIGFVSLADYGVLPGLLKAFKSARPGVALRCARCFRRSRPPRSRPASSISASCCRRCRGAEDLEHIVVQRERFVAALPARHRLAGAQGQAGGAARSPANRS